MRPSTRDAIVGLVAMLVMLPTTAAAQEAPYFLGAVAGSSQLSGDPSSNVTSEGFATSMYHAHTGPAVNVFFGVHQWEYVTLQGNYTWNQNDVTFFAAEGSATGSRFYEQPRTSTQHALIGDVLVYFRARRSRIRPYLSGGVGVLRLSSETLPGLIDGGLQAPASSSTTTDFTTRVVVGVDVPVGAGWSVRYSFSENLGPNPLSRRLEPQGTRPLMNFQNLVGVMRAF